MVEGIEDKIVKMGKTQRDADLEAEKKKQDEEAAKVAEEEAKKAAEQPESSFLTGAPSPLSVRGPDGKQLPVIVEEEADNGPKINWIKPPVYLPSKPEEYAWTEILEPCEKL